MNLSIVNPLPLYCIALTPLLAGGYLLAYRFSQMVITGRLNQKLFSISLFISLWLVFVMYSCLAGSSFITGLTAGTSILCIIGIGSEFLFFRRGKWKHLKIIEAESTPADKWMWILGLITSAIVYFIAVNSFFHDEILINGHRVIIAQLQNDFFPPRNLINPSDPLRYHFGFDLLCAAITAFTRCGVDNAIDIATALFWFYCWIGLWQLGERLFKYKHAGFLTAFITLFSGGIAPLFGFFLTHSAVEMRLAGVFSYQTDLITNPPMFSYFFQHPFAAGLPVTIALLLLIADPGENKITLKFILISILMIGLYFCQTVLFLTLLSVLSYYYLVYKKQYRFILFPILIMAGAYLSKSGLLFTPLKSDISNDLYFRFWPFSSPIVGIILWYAASVGLLFVFSIIGFLRLKNSLKLIFGFIILIGIGMPLIFSYRHTWDMVKFVTVGCFFMAVLSGGAIAWMLEDKSRNIRRLAKVGIVGLTMTGLIHMGLMIYELKFGPDEFPAGNMIAGVYKKHNDPLPVDYIESVNWLRKKVNRYESVLCDRYDYILPMASISGLPTVYYEAHQYSYAFGTPEARRNAYIKIFTERNMSIDDFRKLDIRWVVQSDGDSLNLNSLLASGGNFSLENQIGKLKIYHFND